ncbi:DUF6328 family protein [Pseudonocardia sp.]|uniref:DUF6328 family protein n=1 Tax=Pseudonocardia sp. TaxID=60912 RepID=UPI002614AD32|nr:DUF6328 family protein [Pseudonocardia sp.]MCW2722313.1 hypothetical protein [Pseudonocardia sp.]MDT7615763.1 hypothetical protein [Pseudonocardiales bacterium]
MIDDAEWNRRVRDETDTERWDRNWADLLQELRVAQTGVQLLTGLLLTVPFQQRFAALPEHARVVYLVTTALSVAATALLIAPVGMHRLLFRRHARLLLVSIGQGCAVGGLGLLGLAVTGVVLLIFDTVAGTTAGIVAGGFAFVLFAGLWGVTPLVLRRSGGVVDRTSDE